MILQGVFFLGLVDVKVGVAVCRLLNPQMTTGVERMTSSLEQGLKLLFNWRQTCLTLEGGAGAKGGGELKCGGFITHPSS